MARKTKNTVILAKIETTAGTDAVPTGAANAILVSDMSFDYSINMIERDNIKGTFGMDAPAVGSRYVTVSFSAEISGSGAAGTAPAWGPLIRACAAAETITAAQRVEYTPISTGLETLTIYFHADGVLKKAIGAMGNCQVEATEGSIGKFKFTFTGLDGGEAAVANPAATLTAWKAPLAIVNGNANIILGGTYATGAVTGGTPVCNKGLSLDFGNEVAFIALLGGCQGIDIKDRKSKGSVQLELDAASEVAAIAACKSAALTSLGLVHGSAAGAKVTIFAPTVQRMNPKQVDNEGRVHLGLDLGFMPAAGNDEWRIVAA